MSKAYLASEELHARNAPRQELAVQGPEIGRPIRGIGVVAILSVLLAMGLLFQPAPALANSPAGAQVAVGISVRIGPPPLPIYAQPLCPGPGYIWTPGYWAYDPVNGYYWVPGTWVLAPFIGALWTPGYWGWDSVGAVFIWHAGYWGPRVGFYGGINYGFGYFGVGYEGGYWRGRDFFYNRAVNNINVVNIRNVYNRTVVVNNVNRVSYNGGRGGIMARATQDDFVAERDRRMGPVRDQMNQESMARTTPGMRWSENHGRPDIAATSRPGMFRGGDISRATRAGGSYTPEERRGPQGAAPSQPRRFGQQPGGQQPGYQPRNGGMPQRQYQQGPNRNARPMSRNQGQPQYRGQQGHPQQNQGQRGHSSGNRRQENQNGGERGRQGPPHR